MSLSFRNSTCLVWAILFVQGICVAGEQILKAKIVRIALDHNELAVVRVGTTGVTSLEFPYKIEAIDGYGFSATPGSGDTFQISYTKGTNYFSVRALKTGATGNLTVVLDQKLYSIFFEESSDPSFVNIFSLPNQGLAEGAPEQIGVDKQAPTSAQLAGLLDTAKHYETLRTTHPELLEGLHVIESGKKLSLGKDVASTIRRVLEDDTLGSTAFEVEIANGSRADFCYDPATLQIDAQNRSYNVALQEASGIVKAGASETIFVVVNESASEGRESFAAAGDFGLKVRAKRRDQEPGVTFDQPVPTYLPTAMTVAQRGETPPESQLKQGPVEAPVPRPTPSVVKRTAAKKVQKKSEPKPDVDAKNSPPKVEKPAPKKLFGWL